MASEKLSRKEMEAILRQGGTVLFDGRIIGDFNALPSEADLAQGDTEAMKVAEQNIDAEIKRLLSEKQKLAKAKEDEPKSGAKSAKKDDDEDTIFDPTLLSRQNDERADGQTGEGGFVSASAKPNRPVKEAGNNPDAKTDLSGATIKEAPKAQKSEAKGDAKDAKTEKSEK